VVLQRQDLGPVRRQDPEFRHDPWTVAVSYEVGQVLLQIERIAYAANVASSLLDAHESRAPGVLAKATTVAIAPPGDDRVRRTPAS
jgi:hypothetical protein